MPDIIVRNKNVRDQRGTTGHNAFKNFSIKPNKPSPEGVKVGRAGRRLIMSDKRGEDKSQKQKFDQNYDRIFRKK